MPAREYRELHYLADWITGLHATVKKKTYRKKKKKKDFQDSRNIPQRDDDLY